MKNTEFPLRKSFEQDFLSEKWDNLFTLRYEQATMQEYHEFFQLSQENQVKELYSMIRKQLPLTLLERFVTFFFKWFRGKIERSLDVDSMIQSILENRFRTYESVFTKTAHLRQNQWSSNKKMLFSAGLSIVCQKYCIDPVTLFNNFTLEQYIWLQDWILFNMNEQDKEWQAENQIALVDRDEVKKRAEETRKAFESAGL